jgi:hypothetical protein
MNIEQVHPTLRPLVNAFLLKSKYPFEIQPTGRYVEHRPLDGSPAETYHSGIKFIDPNYLDEHAGAIRTEDDDMFCVTGLEVVAPRRKDYVAQRTKRTKQEKSVLKLMLKMIKPYSMAEIAGKKAKLLHQHLRAWRNELNSKVTEPIHNLGQSHRAVIAEMQNLKALGVPLVTAEFRKVMEDTLAYHDENEYRAHTKVTRSFVHYRKDGIHVHNSDLSPHIPNAVYPNFDALPEDIRGKLAFLKMLKDNEDIPEVGIRLDANTFWVLNMPARVAKGNV